MNIKKEILTNYTVDLANQIIENIDTNSDRIVNSTAINIVSEIQQIITNIELSDFEAIENIVVVFEKYGINAGSRHDF